MKSLRQKLVEGENSGKAEYRLDALIEELNNERDKALPDKPVDSVVNDRLRRRSWPPYLTLGHLRK